MNTRYLEKRLKAQGLTAEELAAKLGLSISYMKMLLKGLTPARHTLRHMALVLGCEVTELLESPDDDSAA